MTTVQDCITAGLGRADRPNAPIPASELLQMAQYSTNELYGALVSKRQKYFETVASFTLTGGVGGNTIDLFTTFPDFQAITLLERQITTVGTSPYFATVEQLNSTQEKNMVNAPPLSPVWAITFLRWDRLGRTLALYPATSSQGTYQITYVPKLPVFTTSSILDGYFLNINGWDEFVVYGIAAKVLIREKDIETANIILQQQETVRQRLFTEAQPDDTNVGFIRDVKRTRGTGGFGGPPFGFGWGGQQ